MRADPVMRQAPTVMLYAATRDKEGLSSGWMLEERQKKGETYKFPTIRLPEF